MLLLCNPPAVRQYRYYKKDRTAHDIEAADFDEAMAKAKGADRYSVQILTPDGWRWCSQVPAHHGGFLEL